MLDSDSVLVLLRLFDDKSINPLFGFCPNKWKIKQKIRIDIFSY